MPSPQFTIIRRSREFGNTKWEYSNPKNTLENLETRGFWKPGSVLGLLQQGFPVWSPFHEYRSINKEHIKPLMRFLDRQAIPERVLIDAGKEALSGGQAIERKAPWEIVFLRNDGWSLGAPRELRGQAEEMWQNEWVEVYFPQSGQLLPYNDYIKQEAR